MLRQTALGFGSLGLMSLLDEQGELLAEPGIENPLALKPPHFAPRAKRVIYLFMHGGPSHVDTFDPKPRLTQDHGKPIPFKLSLTFNPKGQGGLMKSPWGFRQYGESGIPVSELFPRVAQHVDDLCVIRSMVGDGVDHGGALLQLNTGTINFTRPSLGSWVLYGLGTENQNLPGFITIKPSFFHGGAKNWGSAFLPGAYQGIPIGNDRTDAKDLMKEPIEHLLSKGVTSEQQRYELEMLQKINRHHASMNEADPKLEARIQSFELAFRMQMGAREILDVDRESEATKKLYGLDDPMTVDFGWQCLLSRRLSEAGVRFVKCSHSYKWDQHAELARLHARNAREVDKPIAGLLTDLKARGLLKDTLVIWGGEFGRTPFAERDGRDHNPYGFTIWMAGGGVKPGMIYGATDEFGYHAVEDHMHIHDLHATILHLLGMNHEKLTYRYAGRNFRLTDVEGVVAHKIMV
ncbi:MAG: DUF1501 domain-containing protein [Acidobacteria bacterium]|nr:DUF1501 domain-containing protein [Acidobacteriota bacterium]